MSDSDDDDFSLSDESSDDEPFTADDDDNSNDDEVSAASDVSDFEELVPKAKKARVSPKKKSTTPKSSSVSKANPASVKKAVTPKAADAKVKASGKSPAASKVKAAGKSPAASTPAKPLTAENAEAAVLDYMCKTNRPYSLLNVFENMHRAINKPSLTKLLDNLVLKKELVSKTYGKATIYYLNQNNLPVPSEDERIAVEEQIKAATEECTALEQELKSAEATLAGITSQMSDADLDTALKQANEEAATLEMKVETLNQAGRTPISPGAKNELKRKFTKYRAAWVARKRIAMDGVNQIADGMEKKPKAVLELVGLETDEEAGIKELPTI